MSNPNARYANIFVGALIGAGLKRLCLTPGSRHTPLVLAFAQYKDDISIYSHLDERSAAFFALGLAMASNEPVALACTSGTAGANFFPTIIEAHQARIPLIVLTADRPHELRQSGANQTIDQVKMFGDFVEWFYDAPLPETDPPPLALDNLRTLAARAWQRATETHGVVHINLPFRKPLEPEAGDKNARNIDKARTAPTRFWQSKRRASSDTIDFLREEVFPRRGIIYFGHGAVRSLEEIQTAMTWASSLSRMSGYPVFAEFTSNLRCFAPAGNKGYAPLAAYESYVTSGAIDFSQVEALIRFGAPPLSKNMQMLLSRLELKYHIYGARGWEWADDTHSMTDFIPFEDLTAAMSDTREISRPSARWLDQLAVAEAKAWEVIEYEIENSAYFDGAAVYDAVDLLPAESTVFAGSSLPIRHLDQFGKACRRRISAWANRGASGIDGNISAALGCGAVRPNGHLTAILGDITFYHDMNGLLAVQRCGLPITIVLLNNGGGGIFHRLPIHTFEPHFSDYFITAHGLDFSHAAKLYGLEYVRADCRAVFRQAFAESVTNRQATIIEVKTDALADLKRRQEIMAAVHATLETLHLE